MRCARAGVLKLQRLARIPVHVIGEIAAFDRFERAYAGEISGRVHAAVAETSLERRAAVSGSIAVAPV